MRELSLGRVALISPLLISVAVGCADSTENNDEMLVSPLAPSVAPAAANPPGGGGTTDPCLYVPGGLPPGPGDVDPYFGCIGTTLYGQSTANYEIRALALQGDDKIIAVGNVSTLSNLDTWVARFDANGKIDPTFGTNGVFTMNFTSPFSGTEAADAVVVQPDGHIVVGGGFNIQGGEPKKGFLLRLSASGVPDPGFGTSGFVLIGGMTWVRGLALQSNNGLAVVGENFPQGPAESSATYGRFDGVTGAPNLVFAPATGGVAATKLGGNDTARGFALAATGGDTVVVAGQTRKSATALDVGLMKFTNNTIATTFGTNGQKTFDGGGNEWARGIVPIDTGYAIAEGSPDFNRFVVRRIDGAGAPVTSYGIGSMATHGFAGNGAGAYGIVAGSGGKVVVVGAARTTTQRLRMAVARFTSGGVPDSTFSGDGGTMLTAKGDDASANAVVRQSTGKLVVGGWSNSGFQKRAALVRVLY